MSKTSNNKFKTQGIALMEVYISMEKAFYALKSALGFADSRTTFLLHPRR